MENRPILDIRAVSKAYAPPVLAVDNVSLQVAEGETLCILGPSGSGKTTLLRMVAGLEVPEAGQICYAGEDLAGVPPHLRDFGMMFQDFALFPHMNVYDNVAFGLRMHKLPPDEIAVRVQEMLRLVALEGYETRAVDELSGGEQQRVALARALAPRPRLLLLDEPLGALDRALRERLMLDLRDILRDQGITALYVTHDQTEAFAVADQIAVMNAGQVEQVSTPVALYERPATAFVARFLGFKNIVPGQMVGGGHVVSDVGEFAPEDPRPPEGTPVMLLIKPRVRWVKQVAGKSEGGEAPHEPALHEAAGVVVSVSFRGRYYQLTLQSGTHDLVFEPEGLPEMVPGDYVRVRPVQILVYPTSLEN
jgi:ABC-type Fe3+/spermidine/putrescine transport system ATPase subunit